MGFVSNIFRKAEKDVKFSLSEKTGNSLVGNVEGYNKAVIRFSTNPVVTFRGYVDKATESEILTDLPATKLGGRIIRDTYKTDKIVIVDISYISVFVLHFGSPYTGVVYIHLTQDKVDYNYNGVTLLATKDVTIISDTAAYTIRADNTSRYRFIAFQIKRRDGSGYDTVSINRAVEYHEIGKTTGNGPTSSGGRILSMSDNRNGFCESEWIENMSYGYIDIDIEVNSSALEGQVFQLNILGIG